MGKIGNDNEANWRAAAGRPELRRGGCRASGHFLGRGLPIGNSLAEPSVPVILWQRILPLGSAATARTPVPTPGEWSEMRNPMAQQAGGRNVEASDRSPGDADSRLHLDECRRSSSPGSSFSTLVRETARVAGVEFRALAVRALLHLPRVASHRGWVASWQAQRN